MKHARNVLATPTKSLQCACTFNARWSLINFDLQARVPSSADDKMECPNVKRGALRTDGKGYAFGLYIVKGKFFVYIASI